MFELINNNPLATAVIAGLFLAYIPWMVWISFAVKGGIGDHKHLKENVDRVEKRVDRVENKLDALAADMSNVKADVSFIRGHLTGKHREET